MSPLSKALLHGCSMRCAERSDGCQLKRAELNLCLMIGKIVICNRRPKKATVKEIFQKLTIDSYIYEAHGIKHQPSNGSQG